MRKRGKIKVIHPGGNSAVMAYDLASRLLSRNYFAAGSGIAESTDSFTYNPCTFHVRKEVVII